MTKFSVLMSVYGKEKPDYLGQALKSIFYQTITPDEVVICEDGPLTPKLEKVIQEYKNKYKNIIKVVKFPKNRGLGATLHDGVLACSNEIIFRMDSDDICVKNRFEKQLDILEKTDADVIGSNIAEYDEDLKNLTGFRNVPEKHNDIVKMMKKRNAMNHVTTAYKKSKVINAGNYLSMPFFEDYYLWTRMIQNNCKFLNLQDSLVIVRGGQSMIMRRSGLKYAHNICSFEKQIRKNNFISTREYVTNIAIRTLISATPDFIKKSVYTNFLRSKNV